MYGISVYSCKCIETVWKMPSNSRRIKVLTLHGHVLATLVSHTTCLFRPFFAVPRGDCKKQFPLYLYTDRRSNGHLTILLPRCHNLAEREGGRSCTHCCAHVLHLKLHVRVCVHVVYLCNEHKMANSDGFGFC